MGKQMELENVQNSVTELPKKFAFDSLEAIRKRLLDLTGRNSLLNYKHPKSSCVRLIDELPDQIYEVLQDDKKFTFIPVPEPTEVELIKAGFIKIDSESKQKIISEYPTAEKWAKQINLATSYDLPEKPNSADSRHKDTNLQTLLYAPELESRLRSIRVSAESAIEESGANILYLALGFLEWYESRDSDVARLAPLFTLPVQIDRTDLDVTSRVYRYSIKLKDDNLITNVTLREKLANDFNLVLPPIDDETAPENYFQQIQDSVLVAQPRWKLRRQASLVLLNFAKQAMYEDLDPTNWPDNHSIESHPIIEMFFSIEGKESLDSSFTYEVEHPIDDLLDIHEKSPLIYDADSSQHSAVIDVIEGENLVIEGPPGSGKSQTITNIIAASIANQQKVLFVAEKMAALNVVKSRLDKAGLGDFCLELHSHKTNKQKLLSDLNSRLMNQNRFNSPQRIEETIERYDDLKNKLNSYALQINSKWANTNLSIHEIIQKATRLREQLNINPENLAIDGINGEDLTPIKQNEYSELAYMLSSIYSQVSEQAVEGNIHNHYWFGVQNTELNSSTIEDLISSLKQWSDHLKRLEDKWLEIQNLLDLEVDPTVNNSLVDIHSYLESVLRLPKLLGGELLNGINLIVENISSIEDWVNQYESIHQEIKNLQIEVLDLAITSNNTPTYISKVLTALKASGIESFNTISSLVDDQTKSNNLFNLANEIQVSIDLISPNAPTGLKEIFFNSHSALVELQILIDKIRLLPPDLWKYRDDIYHNPEIDGLLDLLMIRFKKVTPLYTALKEHVQLESLPSTSQLKNYESVLDNAGLFKWFSSEWRNARRSVLNLSKISKPNIKSFLKLLPEIIQFSEESFEIHKVNDSNPILGTHFDGVDTPIERIYQLRNWYKAIREEYGIGFGERVKIGNEVLKLDRDFAMALIDEAKKGLSTKVFNLCSELSDLQNKFSNHPISKNKLNLLSGAEGELYKYNQWLGSAIKYLSSVFKNKELSLNEIDKYQHLIHQLQISINEWEANNFINVMRPFDETLNVKPNGFSSSNLSSARNTIEIAKILANAPLIYKCLQKYPTEFKYHQLEQSSPSLTSLIEDVTHDKENFKQLGNVNLDLWLSSCDETITSICNRNERALNNINWIYTWLDYIKLKNRLIGKGFTSIIGPLENSEMKSQELQDIVNLVIFNQLTKEILSKFPTLANFTSLEQTAIQQKFKEYDGELLNLQRKKVAYKASRSNPPNGVSTGRIAEYTEVSLIKHEATKKSRHIAVRSLLNRAGNAIQTLKPCFMMSPMSVAQYLVPGKFKFDLIVMDEASQIRPEDALGAIARGTRLVVVGDPKQLPPTNFFNKIIDDEQDEDKVGLQDSESILESVMPMFKTRRLRWHYRSKHESLIAFSNKNFYDSDLVLFPSPFKTSPEFGVKLHRIQRGRFVNRRNVEEAQELVKSVSLHMINNPQESIGIVAMNSEQRDEIEKQLDQAAKDYPALLEAIDNNKNSEDPLFIKNLENVQGDERDVIYISMTYGPEQVGGRTMQRFGPINTNVGWRRLNVLFTRSKKRMHIFSSMQSSEILAGPESSSGVKALKAFIEFAETGHLHQSKITGKTPDSDFEIAVMKMLELHGYECEPQLGVAGFFLDIAVRDPCMPGKFLMGIECDGATYHSAKSARDRDHLRQEILESLGWKVRRIWSTDWFKNPKAQIQPILNELEKIKTPINEMVDSGNIEEFELNQVLEDKSAEDANVQLQDSKELSIEERLLAFDKEVIREEFPKTDPNHKLLRKEMLDVLLEHLPTSKAEFQEYVPAYIRTGTVTYEAKFLDDVLAIIADYA
jgi:very-short-patch-repair endonuclease